MYKLGFLKDNDWVEHIYPARYRLPEPEQGSQRLVAGVPNGNSEVFSKLVELLEPPYYLLYVLHTSRGEGPSGRYQSPAINAAEFNAFIAEFSPYLSGDGRFDLWAHSRTENATVVWDRHNRVFGYGPLSRFADTLEGLGFSQGPVEIPAPHEHNYRKELDPFAVRVLQAFDWIYSPLREEDEQ